MWRKLGVENKVNCGKGATAADYRQLMKTVLKHKGPFQSYLLVNREWAVRKYVRITIYITIDNSLNKREHTDKVIIPCTWHIHSTKGSKAKSN